MNTLSNTTDHPRWRIVRRDFLKASASILAGLSVGTAFSADRVPKVSFGIVTDSHYADKPSTSRVYRESLSKMTECVDLMNQQKVDFLIELGDFKDQGSPTTEQSTLEYLSAIENVFARFEGPRYHVLGNHDLDGISKKQFLARVDNTNIPSDATYYAFDYNGVHFVVLDACFTADGKPYDHGNFDWKDANIPPHELEWLKHDLATSTGPVIAFVHQQLDGEGPVYVNNAAAVRDILQASRRVLAVFQGHNHAGDYSRIGGIHYYTLKAMVEGSGPQNNAYAVVDVYPDNSITVTGYRKAVSKTLKS
ncbi:MAG: alkaline phosphatase [Planctomycetota bacterium]|nr:MAG: alkaline phosphatase [Planctomycetota bacterium]